MTSTYNVTNCNNYISSTECFTNSQTGNTEDSRITNSRDNKTIRVNVDRAYPTNPKFKTYYEYMKYLQAPK